VILLATCNLAQPLLKPWRAVYQSMAECLPNSGQLPFEIHIWKLSE
jgi:hypothetical protein